MRGPCVTIALALFVAPPFRSPSLTHHTDALQDFPQLVLGNPPSSVLENFHSSHYDRNCLDVIARVDVVAARKSVHTWSVNGKYAA